MYISTMLICQGLRAPGASKRSNGISFFTSMREDTQDKKNGICPPDPSAGFGSGFNGGFDGGFDGGRPPRWFRQ